jgi:hypothetical protein
MGQPASKKWGSVLEMGGRQGSTTQTASGQKIRSLKREAWCKSIPGACTPRKNLNALRSRMPRTSCAERKHDKARNELNLTLHPVHLNDLAEQLAWPACHLSSQKCSTGLRYKPLLFSCKPGAPDTLSLMLPQPGARQSTLKVCCASLTIPWWAQAFERRCLARAEHGSVPYACDGAQASTQEAGASSVACGTAARGAATRAEADHLAKKHRRAFQNLLEVGGRLWQAQRAVPHTLDDGGSCRHKAALVSHWGARGRRRHGSVRGAGDSAGITHCTRGVHSGRRRLDFSRERKCGEAPHDALPLRLCARDVQQCHRGHELESALRALCAPRGPFQSRSRPRYACAAHAQRGSAAHGYQCVLLGVRGHLANAGAADTQQGIHSGDVSAGRTTTGSHRTCGTPFLAACAWAP